MNGLTSWIASCVRAFFIVVLASFAVRSEMFAQAGNTALGTDTLTNDTTGSFNTGAGRAALHHNTTGNDNTGTGMQALYENSIGNYDTATGEGCQHGFTHGNYNTGVGRKSLYSDYTNRNEAADYNTAVGDKTLYWNASNQNTVVGYLGLGANKQGLQNTALGSTALASINGGSNAEEPFSWDPGSDVAVGAGALRSATGVRNTAIGYQALYNSGLGRDSAAVGGKALWANLGGENTAIGQSALVSLTYGSLNTADGVGALSLLKGGASENQDGANDQGNTAQGLNALRGAVEYDTDANTAAGLGALGAITTGGNNTASGWKALGSNSSGNANIALGYNAGFKLTTGSNNIAIGNEGVSAESNTIRIGTAGTQQATFIAGISGATIPGGVRVVVGPAGRFGGRTSSQRFKSDINPMGATSESILALRPVTFRYTEELDPLGVPQFGLVAEEVERVDPRLVARDADGKVYTVQYDAVNAMLLNEFQQQHRRVEDLKATAAKLKNDRQARVAHLRERIATLAAGLEEQESITQRVNTKLALAKPPLQVATSDR
jgi:hypothetical protein